MKTFYLVIIKIYSNLSDSNKLISGFSYSFGSKVMSKRTGIILNDIMDDFSSNFTNSFGVPSSKLNLISPGKRPLSSMVPSVFTDSEGKVRLVIGGNGGTKITTSVAFVSIRHLWLGDTIKQAIDAPRLHHQLFPNEINYELKFPKDILQGLHDLGHKIKDLGEEMGSVVGGISQNDGHLFANADYRKGGEVDGM